MARLVEHQTGDRRVASLRLTMSESLCSFLQQDILYKKNIKKKHYPLRNTGSRQEIVRKFLKNC